MTVGLLKHESVWNKMPHLTTIPKSIVARLELMADLHSRCSVYTMFQYPLADVCEFT